VSNILLQRAKEVDRILETSHQVERAALDIRTRWPLTGKGNNLTIDYSYQNCNLFFSLSDFFFWVSRNISRFRSENSLSGSWRGQLFAHAGAGRGREREI